MWCAWHVRPQTWAKHGFGPGLHGSPTHLVQRAGKHIERVLLLHELRGDAVEEAARLLVVRRAVLRQVLRARAQPGSLIVPAWRVLACLSCQCLLEQLKMHSASALDVLRRTEPGRVLHVRGARDACTSHDCWAGLGSMRGLRGRASCERMGSDSSLSTTLPAPSVEGPPTNSISRAAHVPAGSAAPIMLAATCACVPDMH